VADLGHIVDWPLQSIEKRLDDLRSNSRLIRIRISGDAIPNSTHESSQLIDRSIPLTLSQNDGTATDGSGRLSIIAILMSSILS